MDNKSLRIVMRPGHGVSGPNLLSSKCINSDMSKASEFAVGTLSKIKSASDPKVSAFLTPGSMSGK